MKLLLDQGVPRSVVQFLAASGADAIHVGELGLATATDDQIITYARQH